MARPARILAWTVLGLSGLLALLAALTLARPSWLINSRTAAAGLRRFGGAYRPAWRELRVDISGPKLLEKRVVIHAVDFCVDDRRGFIRGCFPRFELDATVALGRDPWLTVRRLERLELSSRGLRIDTAAVPPGERSPPALPAALDLSGLVPRPLRGMAVGTIAIKMPETTVVSARRPMTVSLDSGFAAASGRPLEAKAEVVLKRPRGGRRRYRARLLLDTDLLSRGQLSRLDARLTLAGDGGVGAEASAGLSQAGKDELRLRARADARAPGRVLRVRLEGSLAPGLQAFQGGLVLEEPAGPLRRVELRDCGLRLAAEPGSLRPRRAELACGLILAPAPLAELRDATPLRLDGTLTAQADFPPERAGRAGSALSARAEAKVAVSQRRYGLRARLAVTAGGRMDRLPGSLALRYDFESGLRVERFTDLIEFLDHTPYVVPAPLNALQGPLSLEVRSAGDVRGKDLAAELIFSSRLASRRQRLDIEAGGSLSTVSLPRRKRAWRGQGTVELKSLALELPYLKIGAFPAISVDERIRTGAPGEKTGVPVSGVRTPTGPPVEYRLRVFTSSAALLYSNLAQDPVPVTLDLLLRPAGAAGVIRVAGFGMKVFGQSARIDHLTLTPSPGRRDMGLEGKVVCQRPGATIDILLSGRTDHPQLSFRSEPPMTRGEIVGLLLFGKTPVELGGDQQASVGNASAAMSSGAFGLASLYLFAATPIESVGYDTATQAYRVRFKLPGGASLTVGSTLDESRTVALRKRLLSNVEVETELRRSPDQKEAVTTFLQWFRRY
jgi:hypothetical protein